MNLLVGLFLIVLGFSILYVCIKDKHKVQYDYINGKIIHFKRSDGFEEWFDFDNNNNCIHYKDSNGYEEWSEYVSDGKIIHFKRSDGFEEWYN